MKSLAAAVTVLGPFLRPPRYPSPLPEFLRQRQGFLTRLLTLGFAVYALSLLATLLLAGSLSDRADRPPVLLAACLLQAAARIVFLAAGSVWWIVGARLLRT
jgi:MFS family permease